jgi:hypothetical protein
MNLLRNTINIIFSLYVISITIVLYQRYNSMDKIQVSLLAYLLLTSVIILIINKPSKIR